MLSIQVPIQACLHVFVDWEIFCTYKSTCVVLCVCLCESGEWWTETVLLFQCFGVRVNRKQCSTGKSIGYPCEQGTNISKDHLVMMHILARYINKRQLPKIPHMRRCLLYFSTLLKKILRRFEASVLCMFWKIISSKKFMTNDGLKKYKTTTMAL